MSDKVKVTFSVEHTTRDGKTHSPDTTATLSPLEARHVLHIGHGRLVDATHDAPNGASAEGRKADTTKQEKANG